MCRDKAYTSETVLLLRGTNLLHQKRVRSLSNYKDVSSSLTVKHDQNNKTFLFCVFLNFIYENMQIYVVGCACVYYFFEIC